MINYNTFFLNYFLVSEFENETVLWNSGLHNYLPVHLFPYAYGLYAYDLYLVTLVSADASEDGGLFVANLLKGFVLRIAKGLTKSNR